MYMNLPASLFLAQDAKFGFGGVKKGMKRNSSQSFSDVSSFNSKKHSKAPRVKSGNVVSNTILSCIGSALLLFNQWQTPELRYMLRHD